MIGQVTSRIIKEFSLKYSDGNINYSLYSKLEPDAIQVIKQQFSLSESRLKYIDCPSCDIQCKVNSKPSGVNYIHCPADGCGILKDLKNNEDLAYKITLNGVADFLIKLLGIEGEKRVIEAGEVIYLGKKELEDLGNLAFNIYLLRNDQGKKAFLDYYSPTKQAPTIIIKLGNGNLEIEGKQIAECLFSDLVCYDNDFEKFNIHYKTFLEAIKGCFEGLQKSTVQVWLNERFLGWFRDLVKNKKIKKGEKAKYKILAINCFGISERTFDKVWKEQAGRELQKQGRVKIK